MLILPNTSERARRLVTEAGQHAGRGIPLGAVDSCRPPFVQGRPGQQAPASPQFLSSSRETPEPEVVFLLSSRHPHFQPASPPPTSYTLFQGHLLDFSVICNLFASKSRGAQPPAAPACRPVAATLTLLGPSGPWFPQASPGLISCSVIGSEPTVHRFKLSLANSHFKFVQPQPTVRNIYHLHMTEDSSAYGLIHTTYIYASASPNFLPITVI